MSAGATSSATSSGSSDPVLLALNLFIGLVTAVLIFPKVPQFVFLLGRKKLVIALYTLAAVSILWSTSPGDTFRNTIYISLYLVGSIYLAIRFETAEIIDLFAWSMTFLALASIPANFILPRELFNEDSWRGIFQTKNSLGSAMAVGAISIVLQQRRWNLFRLLSLATCCTLLVLSKSTTSMTVAGAIMSVLIYLRLNRRLAGAYLTMIVGGVLAGTLLVGNLVETFTSATGKDLTFTGRSAVWALVLQKIKERPVLGYGYHAFWVTEADSVNQFLTGFQPGQAHNGYLEACLDLGMLGLGLCFAVYISALLLARRLNRMYASRSGELLFLAVISLLVHNFAESDMMFASTIWFFLMVALFSCLKTESELFALEAEETALDESFQLLEIDETASGIGA